MPNEPRAFSNVDLLEEWRQARNLRGLHMEPTLTEQLLLDEILRRMGEPKAIPWQPQWPVSSPPASLPVKEGE